MKGISFIICSRNPGLLEELKSSISSKIGLQEKDYEIIAIDNKDNKYSLSSAYNKGVSLSKFNILCFLHEDVRFLTDNFGITLINKFSNPEIAALGVAGSTLLPEDAVWFSSKRPFVQGRVVHSTQKGEQMDIYSEIREDAEVVVLDGLFMAVRKEIAEELKFDEEFKGFHFYDLDFSLRIAMQHKVIVTHDILLQHFSGGSYDESWQKYKEQFKEKHRHYIPYTKLKEIPQQQGGWRFLPHDSKKHYPKILVGCPTSFHKEHCLKEYSEAISSLTYPNYDILLVDNSQDDDYLKKIRAFNVPAVKGPYFGSARARIVASRNLLKQYAIDNDYDYLLSLEQDVLPPKDIIQRMLQHSKQVLTGIYFNRDENQKLYPLAYILTNEYKDKLPDMRPLNNEELWSNNLLEVISAGLGCLLIHRDILKKIQFRYEGEEAFDDRFFFLDLYNLNIPAFADTSLKCKHFILNRPYQWRDIKK